MKMQHALPALAMAAAVVASGAMAHGDERHAAAPKKFDASKVKETVFGREGDPKKVSRTIRIDMADTMRFTPGKTGAIIWQFTKAGEFQFACLVPGHFEAGMVGTVIVK